MNNVRFFTLPFATVSKVQNFFKDEEINTHQQALSCCLNYMSPQIDKEKVNILISHLTVEGGKTSDSECPLTIGTVESVQRKSFKQFDYVMLGHLHHPFSIGDNNIEYSGSLLQYSFSEINQMKGYRIVNIYDNEIKNGAFIPLKPPRELEVIEGDYEDIIQERITFKSKDNYFHFKLNNVTHVNDPMMKLKQVYPNTLALTNIHFDHSEEFRNIEIKRQDDQTIIENFYINMTDEPLSEIQLKKVTEVLNQIMRKEI